MNPARGFFGIGIYHYKHGVNIGTLWRSAYQLGASFIFSIGRRVPRQGSDTLRTAQHIPYYAYESLYEFAQHCWPLGVRLVGIEMGGEPLAQHHHLDRCIYLLGAEDHGLPSSVQAICHRIVSIESLRTESYNVAVAGSIVMYDRLIKSLGDNNEKTTA